MEDDFWCIVIVFAVPFIILLISDTCSAHDSRNASGGTENVSKPYGKPHRWLGQNEGWYGSGKRGFRSPNVMGGRRRSHSNTVNSSFRPTTKRRSMPSRRQMTPFVALPDISWQDFKRHIIRIAEYRELETEIARPTMDGKGIDIRAVGKMNDRRVYLILGKRMQEVVTEPEVREFSDRVASRRTAKGIFITTNAFTPEASTFAKGKPLELIDGYRFQVLLEEIDRMESC